MRYQQPGALLACGRDRRYLLSFSACSLRLAAQDVALSRRKQGFESPRERHVGLSLIFHFFSEFSHRAREWDTRCSSSFDIAQSDSWVLRAARVSARQIAAELNARKVPTARGEINSVAPHEARPGVITVGTSRSLVSSR